MLPIRLREDVFVTGVLRFILKSCVFEFKLLGLKGYDFTKTHKEGAKIHKADIPALSFAKL